MSSKINLCDVRRMLAALGGSGQVLLERQDRSLEVWDLDKELRRVADIRGIQGRQVANVAWDNLERLLIVFLKEEGAWITYRM